MKDGVLVQDKIKFSIPNYNKINSPGFIEINDPLLHYLPINKQLPDTRYVEELDLGITKLKTKSGVGCKGEANESTCFSNQQYVYHNIEVKVFDLSTKKTLEGQSVQIYERGLLEPQAI